jgi:hypothetical protein
LTNFQPVNSCLSKWNKGLLAKIIILEDKKTTVIGALCFNGYKIKLRLCFTTKAIIILVKSMGIR